MKTLKKLLIPVLVIISIPSVAQDLIFKKNREILKVKILEIGTEEIKFRDFDYPDQPIYSIDKEKVSKIQLENGTEIKMDKKDSFNDPDYYTNNRKNLVKMSFSSIMFNHLDFFYERSLTPSTSYEVGASFIGLGVDSWDSNPVGFGLRGGFKFKRSPDFYTSKMRYGHLLHGGYIKPELILSVYSQNSLEGSFQSDPHVSYPKESAIAGSFMINFGKQWVFSNQFALDFFWGIGYGFNSNDDSISYAFTGGANGFPLTFNGGLNIGYLFGDKKK